MSSQQHEGAHDLLSVIKTAYKDQRLLTYETAAEALGRGKDHARAVAQMCDLLDAATAYAKLPLLALIVVREKSGHINRKAWAGSDAPPGQREKIISASLAHRFSDGDFEAIENALRLLEDHGNRAAWKMVRRELSDSDLFAAISTVPILKEQDAIDDLGSDAPERKPTSGLRYARDPEVRRSVSNRANGACELCGKPGFLKPDGSRYVETHHIIALANEGADRLSNVIGLCPEHHREAHYGVRRDQLERQMMEVMARLLGGSSYEST